MRILIITSEEWNDFVYGNGVLTNWFSSFDAEFAHIYCSPGLPYNTICKRYFRITDAEMAKSLYSNKKAGSVVQVSEFIEDLQVTMCNAQRQGVYGFFKKLSLWCHTPVMMIRDFIWANGRYEKEALQTFVDDFHPDIVYCPRMATPAIIRLEKLVKSMTNAPFVAFTADDEASYRQHNWSPLYWVRRVWMHHLFEKHVSGFYKHYWTFSSEQAQDYSREYNVPASTLYKCGDFSETLKKKVINNPIRLVYAGRLYCNRWKTLAEVGKALRIINKDEERMILDIYTQEILTKKQKMALCPENSVYIKGSVNPAQLRDIYRNADIALHVESMDKKNRLATRVSFSTKIIDLMASTCAILAICWNRHCGYQYLRDKDVAFCVDDYSYILPKLQQIVDNPALIQNYAQKAFNCGIQNHSRKKIQKQIRDKFEEVIAKNK